MKICICIATFKRHEYLKYLLEQINVQQVTFPIDLTVSISDNDPEGGSGPLVDAIRPSLFYKIIFSVEKQKGIPFNRNNAFNNVDEDTDFVIFIDDDEYPEKGWINSLLLMQQKTDADVVAGPVYPKYESDPPRWITKGNFFIRPHYNRLKSGDKVSHINVATNNVLIRYSKIKSLEGPFDEKLGLIGCDDSDLSNRLNRIGSKMIWAEDAAVWEWISKQRLTYKWFFQRIYRTFNTKWLLEEKHDFSTAIKILFLGSARIGLGVLLFIPCLLLALFNRMHYLMRSIRFIISGSAMITGVFGHRYEEYKKNYTFSEKNAVVN